VRDIKYETMILRDFAEKEIIQWNWSCITRIWDNWYILNQVYFLVIKRNSKNIVTEFCQRSFVFINFLYLSIFYVKCIFGNLEILNDKKYDFCKIEMILIDISQIFIVAFKTFDSASKIIRKRLWDNCLNIETISWNC
jgi:hypothetical protein